MFTLIEIDLKNIHVENSKWEYFSLPKLNLLLLR